MQRCLYTRTMTLTVVVPSKTAAAFFSSPSSPLLFAPSSFLLPVSLPVFLPIFMLVVVVVVLPKKLLPLIPEVSALLLNLLSCSLWMYREGRLYVLFVSFFVPVNDEDKLRRG